LSEKAFLHDFGGDLPPEEARVLYAIQQPFKKSLTTERRRVPLGAPGMVLLTIFVDHGQRAQHGHAAFPIVYVGLRLNPCLALGLSATLWFSSPRSSCSRLAQRLRDLCVRPRSTSRIRALVTRRRERPNV